MVPVILGALGMIKKGEINTLIRYLAVPSDVKYKKLHFAELFISLRKYTIIVTETYHPQEAAKIPFIINFLYPK